MRIHSLLAGAVLLGMPLLALTAGAADMEVTSGAFDDGKPIPEKFTCDSDGVSPPLLIKGLPDDTRTMALIVDDPDAPDGPFTHWAVYNLSTSLVALAPDASQHELPGPAVTATNSAREQAYQPLCPPSGDDKHHYRFTVYALDKELPDELEDSAAVKKAMQEHVLDKARLTGTYQR